MPKIKQNVDKYAAEDLTRLIRKKGIDMGADKINQVGQLLGMKPFTIGRKLADPLNMKVGELLQISRKLKMGNELGEYIARYGNAK